MVQLLPLAIPALALTLLLVSPAAAQSAAKPATPSKPANVVTRYEELLEWVPKELMPRKGKPWTAVQIDAVNEVLEKKLKAEPWEVELKLTVSDVPTWNDKLQIFSEVAERDGCHIRFFGIFAPEKKAGLAKVKVGDKVVVKGRLTQLRYHTLWNQFTLSIVTNPTDYARWQPGR